MNKQEVKISTMFTSRLGGGGLYLTYLSVWYEAGFVFNFLLGYEGLKPYFSPSFSHFSTPDQNIRWSVNQGCIVLRFPCPYWPIESGELTIKYLGVVGKTSIPSSRGEWDIYVTHSKNSIHSRMPPGIKSFVRALFQHKSWKIIYHHKA